jgi:hypothetical protein
MRVDEIFVVCIGKWLMMSKKYGRYVRVVSSLVVVVVEEDTTPTIAQ